MKQVHIDDFLDGDEQVDLQETNIADVKFFFELSRMPAHKRMEMRDTIKKYQMSCTYKDEKYSVVGASRLGDLFLSKENNKIIGDTYSLRGIYINDPDLKKFELIKT